MLLARRLARFSTTTTATRSALCRHTCLFHNTSRRHNLNLDQKYLDKLQKRAEEKGVSVEQLVSEAKAKSRTKPQKLPEAEVLLENVEKKDTANVKGDGKNRWATERKDDSPVKPLSTFMNVSKILHSQHTPQQISALWTAYHASLSNGTGRGYLSAVIPPETYDRLTSKAKKYQTFLLPLRRKVDGRQVEGAQEEDEAFEFYFMEWAFHPSPPSPLSDPFSPSQASPNPSISTILFTPLQEYKLRQSFSTPHLILTHYTDFVASHGVVLLRGEVTPSSRRSGEFLMTQQEAQVLAVGVQRFYLTDGDEDSDSEGSRERERLLRNFHEEPDAFEWKKLLEHADPTRT